MYSPDLVWNVSSIEKSRQKILIFNKSQPLIQACDNVQFSYPPKIASIFTAHICVIQSQQQILLFISKALDSSSLYTAGITWGNSHLVWNAASA